MLQEEEDNLNVNNAFIFCFLVGQWRIFIHEAAYQQGWTFLLTINAILFQADTTTVYGRALRVPVPDGRAHGDPGRGIHLPAHGLLRGQWHPHPLVLLLPGPNWALPPVVPFWNACEKCRNFSKILFNSRERFIYLKNTILHSPDASKKVTSDSNPGRRHQPSSALITMTPHPFES